MAQIIPLQGELRPVLPTVRGNVDYQRFEAELRRIDELLRLSGVEALFVERSLAGWLARDPERVPTTHEQTKYQRTSAQALRCNVLQRLLGEDFRGMSRRLAECALFQWFCGVDRLEEVRVPSKSQLARYFQWLPEAQVQALVRRLVQAARETDATTGFNRLWLANELELDTVWMDSTCVAADIHFPVDWVLLRDATRTLMKATGLIRAHGLKRRMPAPEQFLRAMNQQCIAMVQAGKRADAKRARKRVLREMKRLSRVVRQHARRHRDLLDTHWQETDWTWAQAEQVLARIDGVLAQLPRAVRQAHERIIGERPVANADKILSLYEGDLHVIVRGKAGAAVEFGNTLFLAEQRQGLVVDWHLYQESAPADSRQLPASLERLQSWLPAGVLEAVGGDRGFDCKANRALLAEAGLFNGLCPRGVAELQRRRHGARFGKIQRRRPQTEGRIGILKNDFLGRPLRAKGYEHRALGVSWSVLAHNLWVLARMERVAASAEQQRDAA
ncbi:MAG: transposase [Verrucomicrobiales bacterium]|nr:transposase [Verrucomicrobiales bacterium]MBE7501167.1 transposase [Verrucomicrobiales bacterium]MBE7502029.1 transposase [Verrucomicrobiales bacterium]MBE7502034.1 transposase [Verrucomicrobiales bacterium]MBE7502107.1 transposase [Verrucomicrobiales bacterium]